MFLFCSHENALEYDLGRGRHLRKADTDGH